MSALSRDKSAMENLVLNASTFDTHVTGKRIATVTLKTQYNRESQSEEDFDLLTAKVSSNAFDQMDLLDRCGFRYVEGEIDLEINLENTAVSSTTAKVRQAVDSDMATVKLLAAETMRGITRFRGPWFTTEESDRMYETWVENAIKGEYDHICLISKDEKDEPTGYITIRWMDDATARIGLFGVSEKWRRQGTGSKLFEHAEQLCVSKGRKKLLVATQTSNMNALHFYQRRGGLVFDTAYCYYKKPPSPRPASTQKQDDIERKRRPGASVLSSPYNGPDSLERVQDVLEQGNSSIGAKYTRKCEAIFESMYGHNRTLLTTSGTLALHLAALAIDIRPGHEVIMPTFTYVSTVNAFTMRGATPVFVDVDYTSMNIDASLVEEAITSKTRAIVVVHYAGVSCHMDPLIKIAKSRDILLIEDAAQGLGSTYKERPLGTIGDIGCLSFHGTKIVTSGGQGGAIIVNNPALLKGVQRAYWNGTNRADFMEGLVPEYTWTGAGYNSQMPELLAALLYSQLLALPQLVQHNQRGYARYYERLGPLANRGVIALPTEPSDEHNAHIFHIKVVDPTRRSALKQYLKGRGIASEPHYAPLYSAPKGQRTGRYVSHQDVATGAASQLLRLPLHVGVTEKDIDDVVAAVEAFFVEGR